MTTRADPSSCPILPSKLPNLLYLTWGEVIVYDGLFNNQVLEQLKQIRSLNPRLPMYLLSGIPVGNRYLLKETSGFYHELSKIRAQLAGAEIEFAYHWIPTVARWFHSQPYHMPFYVTGQLRRLAKLVRAHRINIVHCRSYHATRLALLARKQFQLPYRVLFDTRGMFPEEAVLANYFTADSAAYRRWKTEEQWLFDQADAIVNVSTTFTDYVATRTKNSALHTISTSTNLNLFRPNRDERQVQRQSLQVDEATKVLVYVGSLGIKHGWHNVANLIAVFRVFQQCFPTSKLFIVTRSPHAPLREALQQAGYNEKSYSLVAANSPKETSAYLQAGDYAALSYYDVESELEQQVGHTVIASKSGEYLGVGLPMIVNAAAGAAADLIEMEGVGCVYQRGREEMIRPAMEQLEQEYTDVRAKCIAAAKKHFSATGNARKYLDLYHQLHCTGEREE